ncbi:hypothetical protein [Roseateles depolymerans]|nr:hypothetical protein [Roseateles depolymerans]
MTDSLHSPTSRLQTGFTWHAAFVGAAVGIAGPAYTGTLTSNVTTWLMVANGRSLQEVYAYLGQYAFTLPMVLGFFSSVLFALACGWVSAAYGRGSAISQGFVAGILAASFEVVMLLNPTSSPNPAYVVGGLLIQVFGSVAGAWVFRRTR